jgi:polyhydroxyalkanoate synthesis repressor PhaR
MDEEYEPTMLDKASKSADSGAKTSKTAALGPVVIKKYANRRLYNTETSTYVTLDDLATMVKAERDFVVYDAKSSEDLTHAVLTQIIVEQESRMGGETMLPVPFLQQLIRFYGGNMQKMVPSYLQFSLANLAKEQDRFTKQFGAALTPVGAFEVFHEQSRKNVALFEQAMASALNIFTPFGGGQQGAQPSQTVQAKDTAAPAKPGRPEGVRPEAASKTAVPEAARKDDLAEMKTQMAAMQAMIEKLSQRG